MVVQEKHLTARMGNSANKDVIKDRRRQDNANKHIAGSNSSGKNQLTERACQIWTG